MAQRRREIREIREKRRAYHVVWVRRDGVWMLRWVLGKTARVGTTKSEMVRVGAAVCRALWARGIPAQLLIHGKNGRIQSERTYGRDPCPPKG